MRALATRLAVSRLGLALIAASAASALLYGWAERRDMQSASVVSTAPRGEASAQRPPPAAAESETAFTHFRIGDAAARSLHAEGGVIWVGTTTGIVRYDTATREHRLFDAGAGLASNAVLHLGSHNGRVLAGTQGAGLSVLQPSASRWARYGAAEGLPDARVFGTLAASNGDLWIATWGGVVEVPRGELGARTQWRHHSAKGSDGLPADRVYALAEDRAGGIWAATERGAARFHRGKWTRWQVPGTPAAADAVSLAVADDGVVWVGTLDAGLGAFDGKRWRTYTTGDGLPGNRVFALHAHAGRGLWVGTDKGLALFSEGVFHVLGTADGLVGNAVFSVIAGADGSVWAGGHGGVSHIRRYTLREVR